MKKIAERMARYLEEGLGYMEVPSSSKKFRKFKRTNEDDYIFIGSKGAVRVGPTLEKSYSLSLLYYRLMRQWEEKR